MAANYTDEVRSVPGFVPKRRRDASQGRNKCETSGPYGRGVEVVLLRWPAELARRSELQLQGCPRLLLVEGGAPPTPSDDLEDWIRVPAVEVDLQMRVEALRSRAEGRGSQVPTLDDDGVVRVDDLWVPLPPVEARLTGALLRRYGGVVSRESLAKAGWPDGSPGRNALDVHMLRLRRRLATVSLSIRTVRSRGYLLERSRVGGAARVGS